MFTPRTIKRMAECLVLLARDAAMTESQLVIGMKLIIKTFGRERGFNRGLFMIKVAECWDAEIDRRRLDSAKYELKRLKRNLLKRHEPPPSIEGGTTE